MTSPGKVNGSSAAWGPIAALSCYRMGPPRCACLPPHRDALEAGVGVGAGHKALGVEHTESMPGDGLQGGRGFHRRG